MFKILLAGDGGQGIQLLSDIICRAAFENNKEVCHIPNYGLEQRGGVSLAFIKISDEKINYPKFTSPNILLIMSPQARERTAVYQKNKAEILIFDIDNFKNEFAVNEIALSSYNIFFLGAILKVLAQKQIIDLNAARVLLENKLSSKPNWESNLKAFELGLLF